MDLCITAQEPFAYESPKTKPFTPIPSSTPMKPSNAPPPKFLTFNLLIHDPAADSSLTHPWETPEHPLTIPLSTTRTTLLTLLRGHLPRKTRKHPKLVAVTLYWTYRGDILPLGPDDREWHYRNAITKTDLLDRTEQEWFLLKEMMASSDGALKCYLGIKGEETGWAANRKKGGWWFGSGTA